jgi:hypothetical protein
MRGLREVPEPGAASTPATLKVAFVQVVEQVGAIGGRDEARGEPAKGARRLDRPEPHFASSLGLSPRVIRAHVA